jgi:hypothetical protein
MSPYASRSALSVVNAVSAALRSWRASAATSSASLTHASIE